MKRFTRLIWIIALAAGLSLTAQASMRCGAQLIDAGMLLDEVLSYCGEPQQRSIEEPVDDAGYQIHGAAQIQRWRYGPDNGMYRHLRFIDGRLVEIRARRY